MTEEDAQAAAKDKAVERGWDPTSIQPEQNAPDQTWSFRFQPRQESLQTGDKYVFIRKIDGSVFVSHGKIAEYFLNPKSDQEAQVKNGVPPMLSTPLGPPISDLRQLGSAAGEYQLFEGGKLNYYMPPGRILPTGNDPPEPTKIFAYIAFFDVRGFTDWSSRKEGEDIQKYLNGLEEIIQREIAVLGNYKPFLKGTGDGMMLVFPDGTRNSPNGPLAPRNQDLPIPVLLLRACAKIIQHAKRLPDKLALGCGIDHGKIAKVFLLGQLDYVGKEVNNAAKLQQLAWDEIVGSLGFHEKLNAQNPGLAGIERKLGERGVRYSPQAILDGLGSGVNQHDQMTACP